MTPHSRFPKKTISVTIVSCLLLQPHPKPSNLSSTIVKNVKNLQVLLLLNLTGQLSSVHPRWQPSWPRNEFSVMHIITGIEVNLIIHQRLDDLPGIDISPNFVKQLVFSPSSHPQTSEFPEIACTSRMDVLALLFLFRLLGRIVLKQTSLDIPLFVVALK